MRRVQYCLIFILCLLAGCKERTPDDYSVNARLLPDELISKTLLPRLFEGEIVVCLTQQVSEERKRQFETAAMTWVAPLRKLAPRSLTQRVSFIDTTDLSCDGGRNFDLKIDPNYDKRAHYHPGERFIRISEQDGYGVVLHEFGHAFGLADTYADSVAVGCREGHPRSVMCPTLNAWYFHNRVPSTLLPDDVLGIRAAFCKIHASTVPDCDTVLPVGPRLNVDSSGVPRFRLDATFVANDPRCATRGGVAVSQVRAGTSTERSGLSVGMCIQKIQLMPIATPEDVTAALAGSFGSMLEIEGYTAENRKVPRFINAGLEGKVPAPATEDVMFVYKGTTIRFDDGTTEIMQTNLPCQIRALGEQELRIACHRRPGWAPRENMDLVIEMSGD